MAQTGKSAEALCLYLACLQAGAIYVPLNTGYTVSEIAYFIGDAEPRLFVCAPAGRDRIAAVAGSAELLTLGDDGHGRHRCWTKRRVSRRNFPPPMSAWS